MSDREYPKNNDRGGRFDRGDRDGQQGGNQRRFIAKPKFCQFCADSNIKIDYKNVDLLHHYVTEEGKIRPRRQTGACARHQREIAAAVKRARQIALLPFVAEKWQEAIK